ncbi:MAG: class I tRNA ligase family protein, partial [Cyclobacteriaceae bacterium]|nr:class I tRNA ligase family protein [Cyclobacteriaceae bacterium]
EHATGHLLYSRFWNLFLYDRGFINHEEPFKKLVNQGMIQGRSSLAHRIKDTNTFVSYNLRKAHQTTPIHVDISMVKNDELDIAQFKTWRQDLNDAEFILEDGKFICGSETEKMSKRLHNVVNPDDVAETYGTDTLRLYEMFLGPLEQSKPWDTHGIDGVYRFLKKLWNLFHNKSGDFELSEQQPSDQELKALHKVIKKVPEDIERLAFNTSVSSFMICVNELTSLKCNKRAILEDLISVIAPYAPHICEELWHLAGHDTSIVNAAFPKFEEKYIREEEHEYPIMINGKMRAKMKFALDTPHEEVEKAVLASDIVQKWTEGKPPKKVIIVPRKIINLVV